MSNSLHPWTAACQASLSVTNSWSLLNFRFIELVMPSNHLILCRSLLLPSIFHRIRVFSSESVLSIRWPKYWSFSFSISHSDEYSGLISFRIDWFDLFAVQGTLRSLLQNHSSKASILQCSAFFMVQLSHPYMTTGKTIALTRWCRRQWHPTPVLLPGKSHGWRSLEGCSPWGHWGSDKTEQLHVYFSLSCIGEGNGNPLQCSCLENPRDKGAWWAAIYGVTQSWTRLKWLSSSSWLDGPLVGKVRFLHFNMVSQLFLQEASFF